MRKASRKLCPVSAEILAGFEVQCLKIVPCEEHWQDDCSSEVQADFRVMQNAWGDPKDTFTNQKIEKKKEHCFFLYSFNIGKAIFVFKKN